MSELSLITSNRPARGLTVLDLVSTWIQPAMAERTRVTRHSTRTGISQGSLEKQNQQDVCVRVCGGGGVRMYRERLRLVSVKERLIVEAGRSTVCR